MSTDYMIIQLLLGQVGAAVLVVLLLAVLADQAQRGLGAWLAQLVFGHGQRVEVPVVGPPHDVTGEGDGVEEDRHRDGGDLGVAVVQLPPHVRHAPVPAAGLEQQQQHLLVEGEGLEGVEGVEGSL